MITASRLRTLLFVPGDRPDRMEKALGLDADALILDLEDSVSAEAKDRARSATASFLRAAHDSKPLLVRVNGLDSGHLEEDLDSIRHARPAGLVLPKAAGAASVEALHAMSGGLPVLPIATETPAAIFHLASYAAVRHLLIGLTWGAEDLSVAVGASATRLADGSFTPPYELVRSLTMFAGHAADVPVIETVFPALDDMQGLACHAARARRDGFTGMLAVHPRQLNVINTSFTPAPEELRLAEQIVNAFQSNPGAGTLRVAGRMVDLPHLKQAMRLLGMTEPRE